MDADDEMRLTVALMVIPLLMIVLYFAFVGFVPPLSV